MAISTLNSFNMAWGENGGRFDWQPAQYRQGWATIGDVPPSVEQFNALHYLQDEKANFLYRQLADVVAAAGNQYTETAAASLLLDSIRKIIRDSAASDKQAGVMKVLNVLNSMDTLSALSAAQGKTLNDAIAALNNRSDFCPSGQIGLFAMDYAPAGWLKANGAAVSRTLYANLFAAIGTRYGAGDGYSSFNLPDLRGEFPRFWDDGRGVDAGRGLGTWQDDAVQNWEAVFTYQRAQVNGAEKISGAIRLESEQSKGTAQQGGNWATSHAHIGPGVNGVARTAHETRPRNIALLACIKI